ncbi:MAG: electron transfer flavoprotein subunit beta/FixA family protein [Rothia sp. (in: high G+C Gram-positive bacteria)]|uniref:electron transfer flavoprotein subunit beta/FixA family protein n=1 Tax=Rothia sp. (in: high G+C Gram-positive bacteria) TaxID=1885016 RepID=UPI0026DAA005|nr:electron transfer flavoprotein subunit beta/FixA family protein [Rothia sp. (in: high G+C Gram-positive bacteria)]MDO4884219.1 electron transfer flavoprotein subunit beta/FixA family protein [Rothia sp. (in: high G+C Gram-positive bacteria)]
MSENAYRIAVLTKYVPDTQFEQKLNDNLRVDRSESVMSELDEYAVEAAMQIIEAEGNEAANSHVIAFTLGPEAASKGLRRALQLGAHEGVHILDDAFAGADALATSRIIAAALAVYEQEHGTFDLILAGMASTEGETSLVPVQVSELLERTGISQVAALTLEGNTVKVRRDLDTRSQHCETELPVLLSVTDQVNTPRYPNFKALMAAKKKPIVTLSAADIAQKLAEFGGSASAVTVTEAQAREERVAGEIVVDEGDGGVQLVEFLASRNLI